MRISDWSSDVCSSDLGYRALDFADLFPGSQCDEDIPGCGAKSGDTRAGLPTFGMQHETGFGFVRLLRGVFPPACSVGGCEVDRVGGGQTARAVIALFPVGDIHALDADRKSTRLNSSH